MLQDPTRYSNLHFFFFIILGNLFVGRCHGLAEIKCKHKSLFYEISFSVRPYLFIYFLTMFDDNLIVAMRKIFSRRTRSLVTLDSESLYKGQMHSKTKEVVVQRWSLRQVLLYDV